MILKASQRGSAKKLAMHLLNDDDNDFVEIHEVSGFLSDDVIGAFKEVQAIAKGTKCEQPFFSVSLNPPAKASVTVEMFEVAIQRIEEINNLDGQPRIVIFHEKEGRRHAHAVWSRIDALTMTARQLPYFKNLLMVLSRELFIEHNWKIPPGLRDQALSSPTNVTLAEWQAAKRRGKNAIDQKKLIRQCWTTSDSRVGFEAALRECGYILARGDRRSHVVVCRDGEVIAVPRAVGLRVKAVRARLGEGDDLPGVDEALARHADDIQSQFRRKATEGQSELSIKQQTLNKQAAVMIERHKKERNQFDTGQANRRAKETEARKARFKRGLVGLWQRATGQYERIADNNAKEAHAAVERDREQRQRLINAQLSERRELEQRRTYLRQQKIGLIDKLNTGQAKLIAKLTRTPDIEQDFQRATFNPDPRQAFISVDDNALFTRKQLCQEPSLILDHLSYKKARFSENDIKRALAEYIEEPLELRLAIDRALQSSELVRICGDHGDTILTTKDYKNAEARLKQAAATLIKKGGFAVRKEHIRHAVAKQNNHMHDCFGGELSQEQKKAIDHCLGKNHLALVVGLAGSGKSTMLKTAHEAWNLQGVKVHGAALSGKAADGLQQASGIQSRTLASLEVSWENGYDPIKPGDVLVIDEAGMIGTRQLDRIVSKTHELGAKLVLIGDPDQLQPIEAGTPFRLLLDQHPSARLIEIHRQKVDWQRQASQDLASGDFRKAVVAYEQNGLVMQSDRQDASLFAIVEDYINDRQNDPAASALAFAHRRKDVHALNQVIRMALDKRGEFTKERLYTTATGQRAFAAGDRIVFSRNDRNIGVKNGMLGTVESVSWRRITVLLDNEDGEQQRISFNPLLYKSFDHGYAVTVHKSQGATVDRAYVLASKSMDTSLTYVALTRHRNQMRLYTSDTDKPKWASDRQTPHGRLMTKITAPRPRSAQKRRPANWPENHNDSGFDLEM